MIKQQVELINYFKKNLENNTLDKQDILILQK